MQSPSSPTSMMLSKCCCNSLSHHSTKISPWGHRETLSKHKASGTNNTKYIPSNQSRHYKVLQFEDTSKPPASLATTSSDSKSLTRAITTNEITFNFDHQITPSSAIKDYKCCYTYPSMQRRTRSAGRRPSCADNMISISMPHISATVRPKMIVLGEYCGHSNSRCKRENNELTKRNSIISKYPLLRTKPITGGDTDLSLKMRLVSQPLPSFLVQPSKSIDFGKKHTLLPKEKRVRINEEKKEQYSKLLSSPRVCKLQPPKGTELRLQNPDTREIQSFTHNYMTYCQKRTIESKPKLGAFHHHPSQASSGEILSSKSIITISSPWRNDLNKTVK